MNRKINRIIAIVIFSLIGIISLGFLILWIIFSGGISGIISELKPAPNPNGASMVKRRQEAINEINASFDQIENFTDFTYYATSTHDVCFKGYHDWMRSDPYAYKCSYRITKYYGFDGDFRSQMLNFEQNLYKAGWKLPSHDMKRMIEHYYDAYYGTVSYSEKYGTRVYGISRLPAPRGYENKDYLTLDVGLADVNISNPVLLGFCQRVSNSSYDKIFNQENFQDIDKLVSEITKDHEFIISISIQKTYFKN